MAIICPHCSCYYYFEADKTSVSIGRCVLEPRANCPRSRWRGKPESEKDVCPNCGRIELSLSGDMADGGWADPVYPSRSIYPIPMVPAEVPVEFAQDYLEAWHILGDSPRASAALSRLCLERILVEVSGVPGVAGKNLKSDIEKVVISNTLPTSISELLDAPRLLGI